MLLLTILVYMIQLAATLVLVKGLTYYTYHVINFIECFKLYIVTSILMFYVAISIQYYTSESNVLALIIIILATVLYLTYKAYIKQVKELNNVKTKLKPFKFNYTKTKDTDATKDTTEDTAKDTDTKQTDTTK